MASRQQGYTYLGVLLIVLILGMTLSGATLVSETLRQREKEQELIFSGQQYVNAIRSYYESGAGGVSTFPKSISELLKDPRFPGVRRHMSKPWRDPMTSSGEWDLIVEPDGSIVGVRSRSRQTPLGKFPMAQSGMDPTVAIPIYHDWQFKFEPTISSDEDVDASDENVGRNSPFVSIKKPTSSISVPTDPGSSMNER